MRHTTIIASLTLLVLGATAAGVAMGQPPAVPLEMVQVNEGLYVITGSGGNVAVRVTSESVVLIDDKFERDHDEIVRLVGEVTDRPITYVIGTHHHGDHMGGNLPFSSHAEIIAHANARMNMLNGEQAAPPRVVFTRTTSLFADDVEVRAHHFGAGHTDGDAVVEFPDLRTIHTGDLFVGSTPFIDYPNGGASAAWVDTLGQILDLDFDTVIPGHGPIMVKADVRRFRDKMVTLRARMSQLIDQGVTKEAVAGRLYTDDLEWPLTPDGPFVSRSLSGLYDEIAGVPDEDEVLETDDPVVAPEPVP